MQFLIWQDWQKRISKISNLVFLFLFPVSCFLFPTFSLHPKPSELPDKDKPPIVELEKGVYQVGNVKVDKNKREVTVPGEINLIQGMIEFLACAKGGKLHESVLLLDVEPLHLQLGLILIGLAHENNLRYQGDPRLSKGDPLEIFVEWERNNKLERHRAEELVFDRQKKAPMPKTHWLFTGSRINNSVFMAQATKNIMATYNDPDSIINQPLPTRSDDTVYSVNTDVLPPKNTKVKLIIKPASKVP
jgi:hypothetical protein